MDYMIPYGLIIFSQTSDNPKDTTHHIPMDKDAWAAKAIRTEADEIMSLVNEINESLSKGNWDSKHIEFLNRFAKPLDVAIDAYNEVRHSMGGNKPDMLQVMEHVLNNPDLLRSHALDPLARHESMRAPDGKTSVLAEIAKSREDARNKATEARKEPKLKHDKKKYGPDL